MTKIRSQIELQDAMAKEFSWRKKELHNLKVMVLDNESKRNCDMYVRAAVSLLYAHWEGFIKATGEFYLEFVARRRLKHDELPDGLLAMAAGSLLAAASGSQTSRNIQVVEFFRKESGAKSNINWKAGINTKSNLKSDVFHDITDSLGLDYSRFATKEKLIDERLLKHRNQIAHGQFLIVTVADYVELHDEILAIMQDFYNQIDNAATSGTYKRQ